MGNRRIRWSKREPFASSKDTDSQPARAQCSLILKIHPTKKSKNYVQHPPSQIFIATAIFHLSHVSHTAPKNSLFARRSRLSGPAVAAVGSELRPKVYSNIFTGRWRRSTTTRSKTGSVDCCW